MKLSYTLLLSILTLAVSADKHRLCCCAGFDHCGYFVCDGSATQRVVDGNGGRLVRSNKSFDRLQGAPIGGPFNWMYANNAANGDDDWLGGEEVSTMCERENRSSRCFTPNVDYRNGYKIKGRDVSLKTTTSAESAEMKKCKKKCKGGSDGGSDGDQSTWPSCSW